MSHFVNRFKIVNYGDLVRILFEDAIEGHEGIVETSVVMRGTDADQLAEKLLELRKAK